MQGGEPVAQAPGVLAPPQQSETLGVQPVPQSARDGLGVGALEAALRQHDGPEPAHPAGDDVAVDPAHLVLLDEQGGRGQLGQLAIRGGGQPDPPVLRARRPIGDGDRQPFLACQRAPGRQLHGRAAGHQVDVAVQPLRARACGAATRQALRIGQGDDQGGSAHPVPRVPGNARTRGAAGAAAG